MGRTKKKDAKASSSEDETQNEGICFVCNKSVGDEDKAFMCDCCKLWHHSKCEDVSDNNYQLLTEATNPGIKWYCRKCNVGIAPVMDAIALLRSKMEDTEKKVFKIDKDVKHISDEVKSLKSRLDTVEKEKKKEQLTDEMKTLKNRLDTVEKEKKNEVDKQAETVKHVSDRIQRTKNVLIFGLDEPETNLKNEARTKDKESMTDLYRHVTRTEIQNSDFEAIRLGGKQSKEGREGEQNPDNEQTDGPDNNRPHQDRKRPLLIKFSEDRQKASFMRNLWRLKGSKYRISVREDMNREDREKERGLREEMNRKNENVDPQWVYILRGDPWNRRLVKIRNKQVVEQET
jgi:hypothetical protein